MAAPILMPAFSPGMDSGTVARWLIEPGGRVRRGMIIAEIETDKTTVELEATETGTLVRIDVPAGTENVAVGSSLGIIDTEDKSGGSESAGELTSISSQDAPVAPPPLGKKHRISPAARRLAERERVNLARLSGSGPGGRIVRADIERILARQPEQLAPAPETIQAREAELPPHQVVRLSSMRQTIARRMIESKASAPHAYLSIDIEMDRLVALRTELSATLATEDGKLSLTDLFIRAMALALVETPEAHVQFAGDDLLKFERADISVAVSVRDGLLTPVIRGADRLSLREISRSMKLLAQGARGGELDRRDLVGGSATLSNLGMHGITQFQAVLNPPQSLILAIGATQARLLPADGSSRAVTIITAAASFDHRAMDGATCAAFLRTFRDYLQAPLSLLV